MTTNTLKKRPKVRFKPYSEDTEFHRLASGLALFQVELDRKPIGMGFFDYRITRSGQPSELITLIAVNRLLWDLWTNWSKT